MSWRAGTILLALCLALSSVVASAQSAANGADLTTSVERCRAQLRPQDDVGFARVAARCPELAAQLRASTLAPWLPPGWNEAHNDLSAGGLAEMLRLQREWQTSRDAAAPLAQPAQLRSLVADLNLQQADHNSLWKRLRSWLRSIFDRQNAPDTGIKSLGDWLREHGIGDDAWSIAQWTALALLGLLVARVGWSELRALRWRRRLRAAADGATGVAAAVPTLAEIDAAPLQRQPGMLLALIADLLARRRLLRRANALTADELAQRAPWADGSLRRQLRELADVADPARFAAQAPAVGLLQQATEAGRALLATLRSTGRA